MYKILYVLQHCNVYNFYSKYIYILTNINSNDINKIIFINMSYSCSLL